MIEMYVDITPAQVDTEVNPASEPVDIDAQEHFIKGDTGERGEKGEKGEPFRYEDFTPAQLASLKGEKGDAGRDGRDGVDGRNGYTPRKNVDYFDGKDGADGRDGYTPVKNVDYFDGRDGKDGSAYVITQADYQRIANLVPVPTDYVKTNDARLSDARTPLAHTHTEYASSSHGHTIITDSDGWVKIESGTPVAKDDNSGKTGALAFASDIPSDAHINALIDAKLREVENGTY